MDFDEIIIDERAYPDNSTYKFLAVQVDFLIFHEFLKTAACVNLKKNRKIVTNS